MDNDSELHADEGHPEIIEEGPTLPSLLTDDFVTKFEQGVAVYKRWVAVCYRLTRETHWINHGKPETPRFSLQAPGAEALMNPLGISYEKPHVYREDIQDEKGKFYIYWCEGYMESSTLNRRGYYFGYCDSRDPFFNARPGWKPETGHGDIKKTSYSNWIVNGVTRMGGLRDPDPDLLKIAGLDINKIQIIDYSGRKTLEADNQKISEAQGKRLWALCKAKNVSEITLRAHLSENYHLLSVNDILRKNYDVICQWAENGGQNKAKPKDEKEASLI